MTKRQSPTGPQEYPGMARAILEQLASPPAAYTDDALCRDVEDDMMTADAKRVAQICEPCTVREECELGMSTGTRIRAGGRAGHIQGSADSDAA